MSHVRPMAAGDIPAVAALFQKIFLDPEREAPASLAAYIRALYFETPAGEADIPSLVHVGESGAVTGFIGVDTLTFRHGDRLLQAAICGSLMVEDHAANPMAGARLVRAVLAGPQDISLTEIASDVSLRMWMSQHSAALPQYSLDWMRVLRPCAFAACVAAGRFRPARLFVPVARGLDRLAARLRGNDGGLHWSGMTAARPVPGGLNTREVEPSAFAALVEPLTRQFPLRPEWRAGRLEAIMADSREKPRYGRQVLCAVERRDGEAIGAFAYYVKPGGVARVLQVLARPGQAGPVIDCLVNDAWARGAAALRGRTQPALLEAMLTRRIGFVHAASTVVHARDPQLVQACRDGALFFNGVVGEHWNRINDGAFD